MMLKLVLKIVFAVLYILWVIVLFMSMPPRTVVEAVFVLGSAAAIFVIAYFFHLYLIRNFVRIIKRLLKRD